MSNVPMIELHNGVKIPQLGLGVYKVPADEAYDNVKTALELGYRHIDTASFYENEEGVGAAIRDSGIPREEIFVTTKVWNDQQGYEKTLAAFEESFEKLGLDYIDLYLVHWPMPDTFVETWKALEHLYEQGRVKAIGVSNFLEHHLQELFDNAKYKPVVNQIELHPKLMQKSTVDFCKAHDIVIESWSPIGRAQYLDDPTITKIAQEHGKSPAQIMIRWHVQHGFVVIPKSLRRERQLENISVFDFELSQEEMELIDRLDEGYRIGTHPDEIANRTF